MATELPVDALMLTVAGAILAAPQIKPAGLAGNCWPTVQVAPWGMLVISTCVSVGALMVNGPYTEPALGRLQVAVTAMAALPLNDVGATRWCVIRKVPTGTGLRVLVNAAVAV